MAGKIAHIRRAIAECFEVNTSPLSKAQVIRWIDQHYGSAGFHPGTLYQQIVRSCVNTRSAIRSSAPKILFYDKPTRTYRSSSEAERAEFETLHEDGGSDDRTSEIQVDEPELDSTFALESHLRDYLARHLSTLENGLTLWTGDLSNSVEFAIDGRRIDILAKDESGLPVIIELKLSRGHERTLGQALYYRAKLKQALKVDRIRIIMVAGEVSDELRMASTEAGDVDLFSYALTMQTKKVDPFTTSS